MSGAQLLKSWDPPLRQNRIVTDMGTDQPTDLLRQPTDQPRSSITVKPIRGLPDFLWQNPEMLTCDSDPPSLEVMAQNGRV